MKSLIINQKGRVRVGWLIAVICLLCANTAFGFGNIFFNTSGTLTSTNIYKHDGTSLFSNTDLANGSSIVQVFYGSGYTNPGSASDVPSGDITSDAGFPLRYNCTKFGHSPTFRVWDGTPGAKGSYFGYTSSGFQVTAAQSSYATVGTPKSLTDGSTASDVQYRVIGSFTANHKYDNPYTPYVNNPTEAYNRIGTTSNVTLAFSISAGYSDTQSGIIIPATSFQWKVWEYGADEGTAVTYTGQTLNLTTAEVTPGKHYNFKVKAFNWFPTEGSDWSAVYDWTLLNMEGPITQATTFNFNLLGVDPSKLVINSIAIPSKTTAAGDVSTAFKLKDVINKIADEKVVVAISKWDPATGTSITAAFDTTGALLEGTTDFDLAPGEGVQVYTTRNVPLSLVGQ